jgi:hypothetical protein
MSQFEFLTGNPWTHVGDGAWAPPVKVAEGVKVAAVEVTEDPVKVAVPETTVSPPNEMVGPCGSATAVTMHPKKRLRRGWRVMVMASESLFQDEGPDCLGRSSRMRLGRRDEMCEQQKTGRHGPRGVG